MSNSVEQYISQLGKDDIIRRLRKIANYYREHGSISDVIKNDNENLSDEDRIKNGIENLVGFLNFATDFECFLNPSLEGKEAGTLDIEPAIARTHFKTYHGSII